MPNYPYRCSACGRTEDRFMSLSQWEAAGKRQQCSCCEGKMIQQVVPVAIGATDDTFMRGDCYDRVGDGFGTNERLRRAAMARARAAGVSTAGKKFMPELCRPGMKWDPQAWVSGRSDVARICRERKLNCEALGVKADVTDDAPASKRGYTVAPRIVEKEIRAMESKENGGRRYGKKKRQDLFHTLTKKHSGTQK